MDGTLEIAQRGAWAVAQFGNAELGDKRRTRRLVKLAAQMASNSSGTIPQQTGCAADMKAAYRLFAAEGVTHASVCQGHFAQTRQAASQVSMVFMVQDTAVLNFTTHKSCEGLGPISDNDILRGLHQQNVLAVDPTTRRPLGLMYQRHYCRKPRPTGSHGDRDGRRAVPLEERESYWWIESIRTIGRPPTDVRWVHVGDRGEDIYGVYDECRRQGADWLIRISQDRRIQTSHGTDRLFGCLRRLPCVRQRTVRVRRKPTGAPEDVTLNISGGPITLIPSQKEVAYRTCEPVSCWAIRVWESEPADDVEGLEWLLCTSLNCETQEMLGFAAQGYALRWMIEEFHKCEKTGCQVEMRRLEHIDRLEPLIGLLSVMAVWLLQLKFVAREDPKAPARRLFDEATVDAMARYLRRPASTMTVEEFWRGIGRLGGHPGRKGDGPIGWLRAWRGWQSFQLILLGADLYRPSKQERYG